MDAHLFTIQIMTLSAFYLPTLLLTYLKYNIITYNYSLTITDFDSFTCAFYGNIVWASTFKTKFLKKQNHAARITFQANRFDHLTPLLNKMEASSFYQISLIQTLKFSL